MHILFPFSAAVAAKRPLPSDEVLNALYSKLMVSRIYRCSFSCTTLYSRAHRKNWNWLLRRSLR